MVTIQWLNQYILQSNRSLAISLALPMLKKDIHTIICYKKILYCESEGNYTRIHINNESFLKTRNLKYYESSLPERDFFRIHRSYLVNRYAITGLDGDTVLLKNGIKLRVARRKKHQLIKFLSFYTLPVK